MIQWLTKTRFRTALLFIFFFVLYSVSIERFKHDIEALPNPPDDIEIGSTEIPTPPLSLAGISAAVGIIGTLSTVVLAWKADRRAAKESDLKVTQLQQQITELQSKLSDPKKDA